MPRCEDYPCCGHTDADPCDEQWYDKPGAFDTSRPGNEHALCDHQNGDCDVDDYLDDDETPSGDPCPWCKEDGPEFEPADSDDAEQTLCRGHLAEYEGTSLDGLNAMTMED
jgi:hypothetical protein